MASVSALRRTDLDALRSLAMLLGVALHAAMSLVPFPWPVRDTARSDVLLLLLIGAVHGFRMPLFFLLSGYFTMLVFSRRGLARLLEQRFIRIFLPLVIAVVTIVPLDRVIDGLALRTNRPDATVTDRLAGDEAAVRRRLAAPGAAERPDSFWGLAPLAWSALLSGEWLRVRLGPWSLHIVQTNVFHHLWFLWFLGWLVAAFALLALAGLLPTGSGRWWLVVVSCVPQLVMGMSMAAGYGPDTSFGILPRPHVLAFYAYFFFFGVGTFAAEGLDTRLGRHWRLLLPAAVVLLVAGVATMNDRPLASVLQPASAWALSLGLIGLCARLCSRPSPAVSWLADASYWMYLVHVPLVMVAQMVVRPWAMPADLTFLVVTALVTPVLLVSYRYGVRFTAIGRLLNGPRGASAGAGSSKDRAAVP